jgi:BirA family transcriptional regulator, biotin operon repressor / biotin---[acetyl-CoA-carboxylase] ligase
LRVEWKSGLATIGKRVRGEMGGQIAEGIAEDVDEDGALLLRKDSGEIERFIAGDVTLQGG